MKLVRALLGRLVPPAVVVGCLALAAFMPLHGRNDDPIDESVAAAKEAARTAPGNRAVLDWRALSFLPYDRLTVMDGYATPADIERRLEFGWNGASDAALGSDADTMVLLFSASGQVVAWTHLDRDEADFACLSGLRLTRKEARFVLERSGAEGRTRVFLEKVPKRYRKRPPCLLAD